MKNELLKLLKFNIQLFAEEADNADIDNVSDATDAGSDENSDESPVFTDGTPSDVNKTDNKIDNKTSNVKDNTKAFSERLKKERLKIEQEYAKKKQDDLDKIAVSRGFKDWKELDAFSQKERLEAMGIQNTDDFNSYVEELVAKSPVLEQARQLLEHQKQEEQERMVTEAINEINKYDSDIKSLDDLTKSPYYDTFYSLIDKGYTIADAYKIAAFDKITSIKVDGAKQTIINNIDSKSHFKPIQGSKSNETRVPEEVLATYRKNMPNMTDAEIKEHYNKFVGGN